MTDHPTPPAIMSLSSLQAHVARVVKARGFTSDLNEIFVLLTEEVGELATEFKHRLYYPERFDLAALAEELVDILLYLLDLANGFEVALAELWPRHEAASDQRFAHRRKGGLAPARMAPEMTLNELIAHVEVKREERAFEDTPENLMILLTEEVGEIATEIRKHWRGKQDRERVGFEVIDALTYLLRLAFVFEVDLEKALVRKEQENAERIWHY